MKSSTAPPLTLASPLLLTLSLMLTAVLVAFAPAARAESYVTVRGQYYREPSTRVIQPIVEIVKDLPRGFDISAHYLLDAITSASAASGPSGDNIFTEYRNETGLGLGVSWSRWRLGAAYKYSAESDYWSHAAMLSATRRTWGDTGTLSVSGGLGADQVGKRVQGNVPTPPPTPTCTPTGARTCPLYSAFGGVGYSQVLSPTLLVQAGYEFIWLQGYLGSVYRQVPGLGPEVVPDNRLRNAVSARGAKYFPSTRTGVQLQYRYYWDFYAGSTSYPSYPSGDPWHVHSHTVEARVFQGLIWDLELRVTGRVYSQAAANFWCDLRADSSCYTGHELYTGDPKLQPVTTGFIEGKLYWEATRLRGRPFFGWFAAGTFELSYGRFLQSTAFKNAHLLQTGYSLPF